MGNNTFVKIGNTRLKRSNIKSFGTSRESRKLCYQEAKELGLESHWSDHRGMSALLGVPGLLGEALDGLGKLTNTSKEISIRYLFVTTYQGDNHKFYSYQIDINHIISTLEN